MTSPSESSLHIETKVLTLRRHGRRLTIPVVALVAIAAASGYWIGALPEPWMNWWAGIGAVALALILGVVPIVGWLASRATITTRRVILRNGVFVHHRSEVPLSRVRSVSLRRGPVQRLFGAGDVQLLVGADAPLVLRDVPGCARAVEALQELIEQNFGSLATVGGGPLGFAAPPAAAAAGSDARIPGHPTDSAQ